jgi:uncharacterized protein YgbK (DUF1537 family)
MVIDTLGWDGKSEEMKILALADDMTGALEVGAKFRHRGFCTEVSTQPAWGRHISVAVLDTETRHLTPEEASVKLTQILSILSGRRPSMIYKKTDSTLRGNIRSELSAIARHFPDWKVGYVPAYPDLGRTVKDGCLFVHGRPVCETEFARDGLNPVLDGSIVNLLGPDLNVRVFDGEVSMDVEAAARSILADTSMRIAAGPAALADQLAGLIEYPRIPSPVVPGIHQCVVANGSRHPCSAAQIERGIWDGAIGRSTYVPWRLIEGAPQHDVEPDAVARGTARELIRGIAAADADAVFIIGGDTAFAFIEALGHPPIEPLREIIVGVPVSSIAAAGLQAAFPGRNRNLLLITKAGGFGDPDLFTSFRERLQAYVQ